MHELHETNYLCDMCYFFPVRWCHFGWKEELRCLQLDIGSFIINNKYNEKLNAFYSLQQEPI